MWVIVGIALLVFFLYCGGVLPVYGLSAENALDCKAHLAEVVKAPKYKFCKFAMPTTPKCNANSKYGFEAGTPCIYVSLNKVRLVCQIRLFIKQTLIARVRDLFYIYK
jgi:hypothetical protein